jgi:hypothetical protein
VIPQQFTGTWRRVSIAVGDGAPDEPCAVFWLQAREAFSDLRLPLRPGVEPVAFSGQTTYDPPALTWHHRLDLGAPGTPDVGVVEWRDDDLVERGRAVIDGVEVAYEEVWRRVRHDRPSPILVLECEPESGGAGCRGSLVQVGTHAIVMTATNNALTVRHDVYEEGEGWVTAGGLGDAALPPVPTPDRGWRAGQRVELPGFGSWLVCELDESA